jgi:transcriptional regulator with XRE-family HTH domain
MSKKPIKSAVCAKFGEAVRVTRERCGYSQDRFARHSGLDRSYFAAIERGEFNVSLHTIIKIATALDTKPSALLRLARL